MTMYGYTAVRVWALSASLAFIGLSAPTAQFLWADDVVWNQPGDGNWDMSTNWNPAKIPGAGDNVIIAPVPPGGVPTVLLNNGYTGYNQHTRINGIQSTGHLTIEIGRASCRERV
jgi:hypothetical protein